jgi:hypothetical protein
MVVLNILFAVWAAKWVIDSEIYSFAWFVAGLCFVLNTLSVLQYFF